MKKILLLATFALAIKPVLFAQPSNSSIKNRNKENSNFSQDWFIGAGAGGMVYVGDHNKQLKFGKRISPNFELYGGRWITPNLGIRLGVNGFKVKGLTQNGSHSTGEIYNDVLNLQKQSFSYFYLHSDALFNLNNFIYGPEPSRIYNIYPYAGIGMMVTTSAPKKVKFSPNMGLQQTLKVSQSLVLTLDLRGSLVSDDFDGEKGGRSLEGTVVTHIGLQYTFSGKNGFFRQR